MMKRLIVATLALHIVFGAISSWRAWVQVRSLTLRLDSETFHSGSRALVDVVSSGRVPINVWLEMVQEARSETLAVQTVPTHREPFWDPRFIKSSLSVVFSAERLARFAAGPGRLRVTARGRPQWMREPPPEVRELSVTIPQQLGAARPVAKPAFPP